MLFQGGHGDSNGQVKRRGSEGGLLGWVSLGVVEERMELLDRCDGLFCPAEVSVSSGESQNFSRSFGMSRYGAGVKKIILGWGGRFSVIELNGSVAFRSGVNETSWRYCGSRVSCEEIALESWALVDRLILMSKVLSLIGVETEFVGLDDGVGAVVIF